MVGIPSEKLEKVENICFCLFAWNSNYSNFVQAFPNCYQGIPTIQTFEALVSSGVAGDLEILLDLQKVGIVDFRKASWKTVGK